MKHLKVRFMIAWIFIGMLVFSLVIQPHFLQTADAAGLDQAPAVTIQKVAASFRQSYALDSKGELWAWGAYEPFMFGGLRNPNYIEFFKGKKIKDLQTGYDSVTVLLEDGTVWDRTESNPSNELFVQLPGLTRIQSIGTAPYYTYALDSDGKVWMWDMYEQPVVISELEHIVQLTGDYAVTTEGTVWYLGMRKEDARQLEGLTDVRKIAVGNLSQTGYALKKDGTVWVWGSSILGRLKLPYMQGISKPVQVPGMENVKDLAAGFHHFLMLKEDGTVWAWGQNERGQLGIGNAVDSVQPQQVKGLSGVKSIFSGYQTDHSFAILKDETVWGWGSNSEGETGTDSKAAALNTPAQVMFDPVAEDGTAHFTYNFLGNKENDIESAASNDTGTIVAVTSSSLLISSDNGEHWAKNQLPASDDFSTVQHAGNNFFFWTSNTRDPKLFQSKDGKQWTRLTLEGPRGALTPRNVFLLRNQYVMMASYDAENRTYVFTSTDGIDWKQTGTMPSDNIYEIVWNGARYTAITSSGYSYYGSAKERNQFIIDSSSKKSGELIVFTSNDLSEWIQQSGSVKSSLNYSFVVNGVPSKNYDVHLMKPVSNGIITLYDLHGNILTSKDGISFTLKPGPEVFDKLYEWGEIVQTGNRYFIFGSFWRDEIAVFTSKDKIHWSQVKIKNIPLAMKVIKSGSRLVGFGQGGQIALSTDGVDWKIIRPAAVTQSLNQVIKANGRYSIVGGEFVYSVPTILSSKDGSSWTKVLSSDRYETGSQDDIQSLDWNGKLYVAVGGAYTYTSKDGVKWQKKQTTAVGMNLKKVVWTGNCFAALGVSNSMNNKKYVVYSSYNGVNWKVSLNTANALSDLAAHDGTLVAVGSKNQRGLAMSTNDLTKWQEKTFVLGSNNQDWKIGMSSALDGYDGRVTFAGVQWVNDRFLIMSDMIYSSKDGVNWSTIKGNYDQFISERLENSSGRILWTGKDYRYYKDHILGVSKDLITWKFYENEAMFNVNNMIWTGTDLLAVGQDGLLVRIKDKP